MVILTVLYISTITLCIGIAIGRYKLPIIKEVTPDAADYKVLMTDEQFDKYMGFLSVENDKSVKAQERAMRDYNNSMKDYLGGGVLDVANFNG